jgi:tripeptide aminopeptidase
MTRNIVEIFTEIVQIDSPTGFESEMANYLLTLFKKLGYSPEIDEHNNVFIQTKGVGEPIFLNAHIDTVEPGRGIVPVVKDGIIKSRGETILGADNKVAVAVFIWILEMLAKENINARPLDVLFTTSEESGNYGAVGFDKTKIRAKEGYIFDKDGELGEILSASPYYARFDIQLQGKSAHAARRSESIPVINIMPELIQEIELLRKKGVLINIGRIDGGSVRNTIMGKLTLNGEIRSFNKSLFEEAIEKLEIICNKPDLNVKISNETVIENPGFELDDRDLQVEKKKIESILGKPVRITESYGCSDANIFNEDLEKLKVYVLSDGTYDNHTVDEYVSVENLKELGNLVLGLIKN